MLSDLTATFTFFTRPINQYWVHLQSCQLPKRAVDGKMNESVQSIVCSNNYGLSMPTLLVGVTGLIAWTESRVGWDFRTSERPLKSHAPFPHELKNYHKWVSLSVLQSSSFTASKTIDFKSFFLLWQKSWRLGMFFIAYVKSKSI